MGSLTTLMLLDWLCVPRCIKNNDCKCCITKLVRNFLRQNVFMDVIFVNDCCFYFNIRLHFLKIWWSSDEVHTVQKVGKSPKLTI